MASWFQIEIENSVVVPPPGVSYHVVTNALAILREVGCPADAQIFSDGEDEAIRTYFFSPGAASTLQKSWLDWASYYPTELGGTPDLNALHEVTYG